MAEPTGNIARMLDGVRILTFDCYGTLIDWESGLLAILRDTLGEAAADTSDEDLLSLYAKFEADAERSFQPYRDVLRDVMQRFDKQFEAGLSDVGLEVLALDLPTWPPFDDTIPALRRLAERYALGVISNVDRDLFSATAKVLEVPFDWVITAEDAGSYKPSLNNFNVALDEMGAEVEEVVHVAQSLYHDIAPAAGLGLKTIWVDRRRGRTGTGATPQAVAHPDARVSDLSSLADLIEGV